jgi:hypothetical protein
MYQQEFPPRSTAQAAAEEHEAPMPPLPPLPPVRAPDNVNGIETTEMYTMVQELWRLVNDPSGEPTIRELLLKEPRIAVALAQVLHESALLKRRGESGAVDTVPLPLAPPPPLPAGVTWASNVQAHIGSS